MKELKELSTRFITKTADIFKTGNLYIYLIVLLVVNLFIISLPLIKDLSYEFAAVNSLLIIFLAGNHYISVINRKLFTLKYFIKSGFFFAGIPLITILLGFSVNGVCSVSDTFQFYLVITLPSIIISASLAVLVTNAIKKFRHLGYLIVLAVIIAIPVLEIYHNPQIYFYSPLICFFPGNIYDEGLRITNAMILYRILNIIYFGASASIVFYFPLKGKTKKSLYYLIVALLAVVFIFMSDTMGFSTSVKSLKRDLGGSVSTEHFNIYYSNKITAREVKLLKLLHEYYYLELNAFLKEKPQGKITSYIFYNQKEKGELFGAENADMSKPWLNSIYVSMDSYEPTLKHEIAHCFSSGFAKGFLKLPSGFNNVLLEGTAMAADPVYSIHTLDYMAALAFHNNYKINISSLFQLSGFYGSNSSLSYVYAGTFIKYLVDEYGIDKFKKLYSDMDFSKYYQKSLPMLESEFNNYLASLHNNNKEEANYYYGRPSMFMKKCPRFLAAKTENAFNDLANGKYERAAEQIAMLLNISNSYALIAGYAEVLTKQKKQEKAINFLSNKIYQFKNTSYYYNLKVLLADLLATSNKTNDANEIYKEILYKKPNIRLQLLSSLRIKLSERHLIFEYIKADEKERIAILTEMNKSAYCYETFSSIIDLANQLNLDYSTINNIFSRKFEITNDLDGYACAKVINYQIDNLDFDSAMKNIKILGMYKNDSELANLINSYELKVRWMQANKLSY